MVRLPYSFCETVKEHFDTNPIYEPFWKVFPYIIAMKLFQDVLGLQGGGEGAHNHFRLISLLFKAYNS